LKLLAASCQEFQLDLRKRPKQKHFRSQIMHIVICSSIDFTPQIEEIAIQLTNKGHTVDIPLTSKRIINGELTLADYFQEKSSTLESAQRKISDNVIRAYFEKIKNADAILVLNFEKRGIANYIGGNTFLEMGFAHVLNKDIFLYHAIPDMLYTDELLAFESTILNENLSLIQNV
jgi:diphthamide synthase subunit DPH2